MQRRCVRTPVVRGDQHEDVVVVGLGVLHDDVEVAVLVEDPGVDQLVLHVLLAALPIGRDQVPVGKGSLGVLVLTLHVRVRRRAVQVEPVLLDVLAVVALAVGQPEHPLLEDRVRAVPEREGQAQPLVFVADPGDAILAPPVGPGSRLIVGEVVPGLPVRAVVLAHRPPLALAQVWPPRLPRSLARPGLLQPPVLRCLRRGPGGSHEPESDIGGLADNGARTRTVWMLTRVRSDADAGPRIVVRATRSEGGRRPCPGPHAVPDCAA